MTLHGRYDHLLQVVDSAVIALLELDLDGRILFVSNGAASILGYPNKEALAGQPVQILFDVDYFEIKKHIDDVHSDQVNFARQNGDTIPVEYWSTPLLNGKTAVGYVLSFLDIRDRRWMQTLLLRSEASLKKAQQIAHIGNWDWDIATGELTWSDEIYRIFGLTPQEFGATYDAFLRSIHPEDRDTVIGAVNESVANPNKKYSVEHRVVRPDGEIRHVHEQGEVTYDANGKPLRMIGSVLDITERKLIEMRLVESQRNLEQKVAERTHDLVEANIKLQQLDQLKSMFIASMSHELRTPLNSIIGFSGVMLKGMSGSLNPLQTDQLGRVNSSAKHLLSLISDIIDISKIEAGRVDVDYTTFSLSDLLRDAASNLKPDASQKDLQLNTLIESNLVVTSDRTRLLQAVLNLLSNAVKFTERGEVTLRAKLIEDEVLIEVIDTGIGVSADNQQRLFKAFERFDSHLKVKAGGTGLGLYLTKKIVNELLRGQIGCDSILRKGSRFWIKIPLRVTSNTPLAPAEAKTNETLLSETPA